MNPGHLSIRVATRRSDAFTLVEVLVVVVILGVLAAIVVPTFVSAASDSRINALKANLYRVRSQIEVYKTQHNAAPTLEYFTEQMTLASDVHGNTAARGTEGYDFGPYLNTIPENSNTGHNVVGDGVPGTSDWYYDQNTGDFRANDSVESRQW